jgi:hypothetical protein
MLVNRARLDALRDRKDGKGPRLGQCETGNLEIGTVNPGRTGRVPREVNVVVTGDVINLGGGRGVARCR